MKTAIRLNAVTRSDRNAVITAIGDAVAMAGGWIEDVHFFSNISVSAHFILPAQAGIRLAESLTALPMTFDADQLSKLAELPNLGGAEEVTCTLQITFFHDEPDLRRDIPSVPG